MIIVPNVCSTSRFGEDGGWGELWWRPYFIRGLEVRWMTGIRTVKDEVVWRIGGIRV